MGDMLGRILGGSGAVGGIFGEAREALVGGCWGIFMSAGFFFLFFVTGLTMLFGVTGTNYEINLGAIAFPFVCLLGISALLSPFIGALFGAQSGMYSMVRHVGCFIIYVALLLGGMVAAILYL